MGSLDGWHDKVGGDFPVLFPHRACAHTFFSSCGTVNHCLDLLTPETHSIVRTRSERNSKYTERLVEGKQLLRLVREKVRHG